jgi:hypothetical protein
MTGSLDLTVDDFVLRKPPTSTNHNSVQRAVCNKFNINQRYIVGVFHATNNGVIIGSRGALVIDSEINGAMARQIQEGVRQLTDKPPPYIFSTNYLGDHTSEIMRFPTPWRSLHIGTRDSMNDLQAEKNIRARNLFGNDAVIMDVRT